MNFCPIALKSCQRRLTIFPILNNLKKLPKTSKILPNWRNFDKSGHTGRDTRFFSHLLGTLLPIQILFRTAMFQPVILMQIKPILQ